MSNRSLNWQDKLNLIRRHLDESANLRFPDINGNWYLISRIEVADRGGWIGSGFNAATPAKCLAGAYSAYASGKFLLLAGGDKVTWDGFSARHVS